jgi:hypothetical protein
VLAWTIVMDTNTRRRPVNTIDVWTKWWSPTSTSANVTLKAEERLEELDKISMYVFEEECGTSRLIDGLVSVSKFSLPQLNAISMHKEQLHRIWVSLSFSNQSQRSCHQVFLVIREYEESVPPKTPIQSVYKGYYSDLLTQSIRRMDRNKQDNRIAYRVSQTPAIRDFFYVEPAHRLVVEYNSQEEAAQVLEALKDLYLGELYIKTPTFST